jgi:tRNA nucleotidyltransferase (CCA-adding enzyme)
MKDIDSICRSVLSRIRPKESEKNELQTLAQRIIDRIDAIGQQKRLQISGKLVGSSARGTWLSGERDLDIFIMFPPDVGKEELKEKGLYVARKVAEEAEKWEERYAEHPYINAVFSGFEVDLVPAFSVMSASEIKSAVDRTPFHNAYIESRIKGLEDEVLLLKQFMKGIDVYGSELRTQGFSGYLVELLVIYYGSFQHVLEAACSWKYGTTINLEDGAGAVHRHHLIVVDPTDPARNVAAALSLDNMCIFIDKAEEFLREPSETFFKEQTPAPLNDSDFRDMLVSRGTSLIAIEFKAPQVVEDVLFPQLHKMERSVTEMLERYDFRIYNTGVWADEKAVVLFELEGSSLPRLKKHTGPKVWSGAHARDFKSKYKKMKKFSNVYIKNGRYMVEIPRKYDNAKQLIEAELVNCGLGKHTALSIKKEYHVLEDDEILNVSTDEFRRFLRKFFEK